MNILTVVLAPNGANPAAKSGVLWLFRAYDVVIQEIRVCGFRPDAGGLLFKFSGVPIIVSPKRMLFICLNLIY